MRQVVNACLATLAAIGGLLKLGTLVQSWSWNPSADPHRHSDVRQVVEACLATRAVNGGLLELGSLRRYVSASAPPCFPFHPGASPNLLDTVFSIRLSSKGANAQHYCGKRLPA